MRRAYLAAAGAATIAVTVPFINAANSSCPSRAIDTKHQAIEFAKDIILENRSAVERSGFANGAEYIRAIERNQNCCDASYGPYEIEGSGIGWNVQISAFGVPIEFQHILEFDKCGTVIYNGGLNMGPASRTP